MNSPSPTLPVSSAPSPADPHDWFNKEVHVHDEQLKAYLRGTFPAMNRHVEDVVQESYLRIWKVSTDRQIASAKSFLFTIARNLTLNLLRSERRSRLIPEGEKAISGVIDESPSVAEQLSNREKIELLTDALAALPDRTRVIVFLHKFQGITQVEVARQLGVSLKTVEHQVKRGVDRITRYIRERGYDIA